MACLEKKCKICHYQWFDNGDFTACPNCKNTKLSVTFDESLDFESPSGDDYDVYEED